MPHHQTATAASQVTGAKRTEAAFASCTQHASILRLLRVHAREAADVLLWQPSCGRKPSKAQPMTAMLCKKPPCVTSSQKQRQRKSIRGVQPARTSHSWSVTRITPSVCRYVCRRQITWPTFSRASCSQSVYVDSRRSSPESSVVVPAAAA
jgi:hypothetical protein